MKDALHVYMKSYAYCRLVEVSVVLAYAGKVAGDTRDGLGLFQEPHHLNGMYLHSMEN